MKISGVRTRSIWLEPNGWSVGIFDQRQLPFSVERLVMRDVEDAVVAIAPATHPPFVTVPKVLEG